jgi:hypothetical protein
LIFAADKVAKTREFRTLLTHDRGADEPRPEELVDKLEHYAASLEMLEELIPDHPLVRQLRFDLEALDTYPPAGMSMLTHSAIARGMRSRARARNDRRLSLTSRISR